MKAAFASVIITLLALSAAHAKSRHCMLRIHAEANPKDTAIFAASVQAKLSGKDVAIEKLAKVGLGAEVAGGHHRGDDSDPRQPGASNPPADRRTCECRGRSPMSAAGGSNLRDIRAQRS